jgi:hypothetical protein
MPKTARRWLSSAVCDVASLAARSMLGTCGSNGGMNLLGRRSIM